MKLKRLLEAIIHQEVKKGEIMSVNTNYGVVQIKDDGNILDIWISSNGGKFEKILRDKNIVTVRLGNK